VEAPAGLDTASTALREAIMKKPTLSVGDRVCVRWTVHGFLPLVGRVVQTSKLGLHLDVEADNEFEFDPECLDGAVAVLWSSVRRADPLPSDGRHDAA
jgi:hypothetical protein